MSPLLIVFGALALIGGAIYAVHRAEQQRREALARIAGTLGFHFTPGDAVQPGGGFPLYERGHGRRASNLMTGETAGQPVELFDYRFVTGSGKNQTTHNQTVVVFPQGARGLPDFELSPENILHKIGQVFGYQDFDFEDDPEFSKSYLLRGRDEPAIRNTFTGSVRAFLAQHRGWTVQTRAGAALLCRERRRVKPEDLPGFLADALSILSGLGSS